MKKYILILLLFTGFLQSQILTNPTFGNTTTNTLKVKTNTEASTSTKLSTQETDGSINFIQPINVPIPYSPSNYTISNQSIGQHLTGIDTRLGQISSTTAGITQRVYFTADNTTVTAGTFFTSSTTGKGSTATGSPPALVLADNTKGYFTKDIISVAFPASTIGYAGSYTGQLTVSATPTPVATQQRFTVEIYRTNNGGTPIASGVSGAPTGDLGVTVVAILDSGILNLTDGSITNIPITGILTQNITLNTGERLRYHVSAAKIGSGGGNVTFGVYYGSSYNSYYDVPVAITTDAVLNKSGVTGVTNTDALNTLNTLKAPLSNPTFTGNVNVPTPTLATDAVNKSYADGLVVGLLDDRGSYDASSNLFPTTGGSGFGGSILKGDIWYVSVAGTLGGIIVNIGDSFRALVDSPGQNASNWSLLSSNLSYVPENSANKQNSLSADVTNTKYPTVTAVNAGLATKQNIITNPVTGTGSSGQISFWDSTSSQIGDSNLFWDNTNKRIGLGTSSPSWDFTISKASANTALFVNTQASGITGGSVITLQSDDNAPIVSGDRLGAYVFGGRYATGAGNVQNSVGGLSAFAVGNWTSATNATADIHVTTRRAGSNVTMAIFGSDGVFYLGNSSGNISNDPAMIIKRNLTGSPGLNGHAYVDEGTINRDGVIGYNSFDCKTEMQGSFNYDHFAGFQSRPRYMSNGNINRLIGYQSLPHTSTTGVISNIFGYDVYDPTGTGTVTNNYGLHVRTLTRGANNWGIYVQTNNSYLGGDLTVNTLSGTGDRNVLVDSTGKLKIGSIDSRPYKVYTALLTQSGTSAPTAIVLENTLGGTVVWTRSGVGSYVATLTGAFVLNKTSFSATVNGTPIPPSTSSVNIYGNRATVDTIAVSTVTNTGFADGTISPAYIEIRVYN